MRNISSSKEAPGTRALPKRETTLGCMQELAEAYVKHNCEIRAMC
jgi:hypothetical protein